MATRIELSLKGGGYTVFRDGDRDGALASYRLVPRGMRINPEAAIKRLSQ